MKSIPVQFRGRMLARKVVDILYLCDGLSKFEALGILELVKSKVVSDASTVNYSKFLQGTMPDIYNDKITAALTAAALWRELSKRQGNGLAPLRTDWIAVTPNRLSNAIKALTNTRTPKQKGAR